MEDKIRDDDMEDRMRENESSRVESSQLQGRTMNGVDRR